MDEKYQVNMAKQGVQTTVKGQKTKGREYLEALFTAVIVAFTLRAFVIEAYKIPSKSMVPTLMVGDHIFVNKFTYGIRIPFTKKWIARFKPPQRGDVIVFKYPKDESKDFIKRVVGLPGDTIKIDGEDVLINGEKVAKVPITVSGQDPSNKRELLLNPVSDFPDAEKFKEIPFSPEWQEFHYFLERMGNHTHVKQQNGEEYFSGSTYVVPPDHLFCMGDNRDNSDDSRHWLFVPMENLEGRAMFIWLSWDYDQGWLRFDRFGKWVE